MAGQLVGTRIKALRKERGLSQDGIASLLGFKDRQTVSAIETGIRRVTAGELLLAVEKLEVPLDYFTDPFRLDGEGLFSWRQRGVGLAELGEYEQVASRWIGAYRAMSAQVGRQPPLMRRALGLTRHSSLDEAADAGERFSAECGLGDVPARQLEEAMQVRLGILVLMVDAYQGISAAACRLPELDTVLISRNEVEGRRNFDLAHELFHILTWDAMPPEHVEDARDFGGNRVEQLANNFAAAVLMPKMVVDSFGDWGQLDGEDLIVRLNDTADELNVTSSALRWRLVALRHLNKARALAIPQSALGNNGREKAEEAPPPLFSRPLAEVVALAIEQGHVSVRRSAKLLGVSVEGLEEFFSVHGLDCPIGL